MLEITSVEQERRFVEYTNVRNSVRTSLARVYAVSRSTLGGYENLTNRLAEGGDLAEFADYDQVATAPVQPYINQLKTAMGAIVAIMEGIERAVPNTFGIDLPPIQEEE